MKKTIISIMLALIIVLLLQTVGFSKMIINSDNSSKGYITVKSTTELNKKYKVRLQNGNKVDTFDLTKANEEIPYALTLGNGNYKVTVYENTSGDYYKVNTQKTVNVKVENDNDIYLLSTEEINWNENQRYIKLAKELTKNAKTDEEKVQILYNYLTKNFTYNYVKIYQIPNTYKPDLEKLYDEKTGICYDYSAIFAGMLRSLGIPTKMVKGYTVTNQSTYHAWNQVLVNGEWKMIDTTNDAYRIQNNIKVDMYKADSSFIVSNVY
ncbi:MAG: transglutaminase-like domain-containing protein [Clostridia bacterium]|nr:transglutaminase-like domain-containing protein [Clostridia bacterium]